jgi:ATP-dependent Clp protease ATP-binding subunit ClpC
LNWHAASCERSPKRLGAKTALRAANEEATNLGHNYLGTEHLLLGLFEPAGGIAAQLLAEWGIARAVVIEKIGELAPRSPVRSASSSPLYTPRAALCLDRAQGEALSLGHNYVGTEHLLLALFDDGEGLAAKILRELGADRDQARDRIVEKLSGYRRKRS